jgi:DedD protein
MSDEGFHEIQLNGKQLVFLFMAATVVSVVIFLCGVMVGRGVRAQQVTAGPADVSVVEAPVRPEAPAPEPPPPATAAAKAEPPQPEDDYQAELTRSEPGKEPKVAPRETPKAPEPAPPTVPARAEAKPEEKAPPQSTPASVTSGGFVVQIAALRDRVEADAIVKRLAGKGYQAFVVNPVPGRPPVYKVQVGRFAERGDADRIAARLKSEEQFSPWVTR